MACHALQRWLTAAFLLTMLGIAPIAAATSCAPRSERFFSTCTDGICQGAFRVTQVSAFGTCGRRATVLDIDLDDGRLLARLIREASPHANGVFEVTFPQRYGFNGDDNTSGELAQLLDTALGERRLASAGGIAVAAPSATVAQLNKAFGPQWLSQNSPNPSPEAVASARGQWETKATGQLWSSVLGHVAYWVGLLLVLVVLVWSIDLFFTRLHAPPAAGRFRRLLKPVVVQIAIGAVNVGLSFVMLYEFWLGVFFVPAVVVILLAEAWSAIRHRRPA